MLKIGFDRDKYLEEQSRYIMERVNAYDKLYLEFGGKLSLDLHAMRVLPGFDAKAKIKLLQRLKDSAEIIICVYAGDIERSKIRGDFGITYDDEVLRMIDDFRSFGLLVNSVVITRYNDENMANTLKNILENRGLQVYLHTATQGYPVDIDTIVSDEGYGRNPYIETTRPLVVLTAPGPNSGKLATALSQLYHEIKRGNNAGYSKFETFPVWNLPVRHPVNIAYESATADLKDFNMIDPYHLEAYGVQAVNYNRDVEAFPLVKRILTRIYGEDIPFKSPTDMGVNRAGFCITDPAAVEEAANQEIIRRYFSAACDYKQSLCSLETYQRTKLLMEELNLKESDRAVVTAAREYILEYKKRPGVDPDAVVAAAALQLDENTIVTGRSSNQMTATAACLLNAIKKLSNLHDDLHLLSPVTIDPMYRLKAGILKAPHKALNSHEVLMALAISAATNPVAHLALQQLDRLKSCQAHTTVMLDRAERDTYRSLGIDVSSDPNYMSNKFYQGLN